MKRATLLLALLLVPSLASAHVGSPDVFHEGDAGPHKLLVSIRTPEVIPGVAEVTVRAAQPGVRSVQVVPLPLGGDGAKHAPTPDTALPMKEDPQSYRANIWLMAAGSWQVKITATGDAGSGSLSVPVPALPRRTRGMQLGLGLLLAALGMLLAGAAISIIGAIVRDSTLDPAIEPDARRHKRGLRAMAITALGITGMLWGVRAWWGSEADDYAKYVYKPLELSATVDDGTLNLTLSDPGWLRGRRLDDWVPDHGHLVHLFMVRVPELDRVWHLHPEESGVARFAQKLPPVPKGRYALFADVVHQTGLAETATVEVELPDVAGTPLSGDDASGPGDQNGHLVLADGAPTRAKQVGRLAFRILDEAGAPARDLELYMGMAGHAAVVRRDRSVFAHLHPTGSVPMAALTVAGGGDPHAGHVMGAAAPPAEVSFPYAFPSAGEYRVFVQIKRGGAIRTGSFDFTIGE